MPVTTQLSAAPALARENDAVQREIEQLMAMQQARQAASDFTADVAPRFRQAVQAAQVRVRDAERALEQADVQVRLRIARERPSPQLERQWYEDATISQANEVKAAKAALADAELQLGRQIQARRELRQLEQDAPHQRAEAERIYRETLAQIETRLVGARLRVLD